jgi:trehalose-6-phosphate synthase
LIARLSDKRKIGLNNTADLIIGDRIGTGDLKFYGHGSWISEDVFTIAGRASWILNQLTGENFAEVHSNLSPQDAENFKKRWNDYINKHSIK